MDIFIVKVVDIVLNLLTVGANLFIMGFPIIVIRAFDRYRKDWRGRRYYWLAFTLVVAWNVVLVALIGHRSRLVWVSVLATLVLTAVPIIAITLLDRYRKNWRGWGYYLLAFANAAAIYALWAFLVTLSGLTRTPVKH